MHNTRRVLVICAAFAWGVCAVGPAQAQLIAVDMNCDGRVDFGDINPYVLALTDPAGYHAQQGFCDTLNGDINGDGYLNFDDINPFVYLLQQE